jgi:hypothetical protein
MYQFSIIGRKMKMKMKMKIEIYILYYIFNVNKIFSFKF